MAMVEIVLVYSTLIITTTIVSADIRCYTKIDATSWSDEHCLDNWCMSVFGGGKTVRGCGNAEWCRGRAGCHTTADGRRRCCCTGTRCNMNIVSSGSGGGGSGSKSSDKPMVSISRMLNLSNVVLPSICTCIALVIVERFLVRWLDY